MSYDTMRDPRIPGIIWPATAPRSIPALFGLPTDALPDEGRIERQVYGITMWIAPKFPGNKGHRAMALCPICSKCVSIGRLYQHGKIHR